MATIHRLFTKIQDNTSLNEMQPLVNNYWGTAVEEKVFPIAYWQLNQLFIASTSEEVALRVRNIDNPSLVDAEWIVFGEGMEELLEGQREREYYFVFKESAFEDMRDGIPLLNPINTIVIWGRLGKSAPDGNDYTAFIVSTGCTIIPPGAGGDGAATGLRIPPG